MRTSVIVLIVAIVLIASAFSAAAYVVSVPRQPTFVQATGVASGYGGGMMGGWRFQPTVTATTTIASQNRVTTTSTSTASFSQTSSTSTSQLRFPSGTMQIDQAIAMMRALPAYAQLNAANNTITFTSKAASVLVIATMPEEAANLTGLQPPKYANGDVFVIYGLINPTLVFQKGATLNLTVVNLDNDMFHNFVLTSLSPPYSYMMMASGGMGPGMMYRFFSTMPLMAPASYQQGYAHVYSYDLTLGSTGTFWYACTYPGHAQSGMYGVIVTR